MQMNTMYLNQLNTRETFFMTKNGLDNLKKRLDTLMRDRLEAIKRMRTMDYEDKADPLVLSEQVRRLEISEIEAAEINNLLQHVEPVLKLKSPQRVQIGTEVTLRRGSKKVSYTIVCPLEIDIETNKISEECPLGRALLGKRLHETVVVPTRKGEAFTYEIIDIK
jgi:transcription elongation factor GreA